MAEHMTVALEQEVILPSSTVEDTCTVCEQEEDAQMEFKKIKGKH